MKQNGTYYIGRLVKSGFDSSQLIDALKNPKPILKGTYSWTFTHVEEYEDEGKNKFLFGKLTKFKLEGQVKILDRQSSLIKEQIEPDLIISSSPFVYLPAYSGIAYLHVWNQIDQKTFVNKFKQIVLEKFDNFFVDCDIQSISDIKSFLQQLRKFSEINLIRAKVKPPNPLFGHLWKSLNEYLKTRNASALKIEEKSDNKSLNTDIIELLNEFDSNKNISNTDSKSIKIGDAAILMSIDGYVHSVIEETKDNKFTIIRTNEKMTSLKFDKDPNPFALYYEVLNT